MDHHGIPIKHERGQGQPAFVNPANLQRQNAYQIKQRYNSLEDFIQEAEIFQPGHKQNCVGLLKDLRRSAVKGEHVDLSDQGIQARHALHPALSRKVQVYVQECANGLQGGRAMLEQELMAAFRAHENAEDILKAGLGEPDYQGWCTSPRDAQQFLDNLAKANKDVHGLKNQACDDYPQDQAGEVALVKRLMAALCNLNNIDDNFKEDHGQIVLPHQAKHIRLVPSAVLEAQAWILLDHIRLAQEGEIPVGSWYSSFDKLDKFDSFSLRFNEVEEYLKKSKAGSSDLFRAPFLWRIPTRPKAEQKSKNSNKHGNKVKQATINRGKLVQQAEQRPNEEVGHDEEDEEYDPEEEDGKNEGAGPSNTLTANEINNQPGPVARNRRASARSGIPYERPWSSRVLKGSSSTRSSRAVPHSRQRATTVATMEPQGHLLTPQAAFGALHPPALPFQTPPGADSFGQQYFQPVAGSAIGAPATLQNYGDFAVQGVVQPFHPPPRATYSNPYLGAQQMFGPSVGGSAPSPFATYGSSSGGLQPLNASPQEVMSVRQPHPPVSQGFSAQLAAQTDQAMLQFDQMAVQHFGQSQYGSPAANDHLSDQVLRQMVTLSGSPTPASSQGEPTSGVPVAAGGSRRLESFDDAMQGQEGADDGATWYGPQQDEA